MSVGRQVRDRSLKQGREEEEQVIGEGMTVPSLIHTGEAVEHPSTASHPLTSCKHGLRAQRRGPGYNSELRVAGGSGNLGME